jgi:thioesterase domain-containing protein
VTDPRVLVAALETQADSRRVPVRLAGFSFGGLVAT